MFPILAENQAGINIGDILPALSSVSSIGFSIWLSYYTTTTTIPRMQQQHMEERKAAHDAFQQSLKELVDELKQTRADFDRWRMKT
jgi:hypothetical protein